MCETMQEGLEVKWLECEILNLIKNIEWKFQELKKAILAAIL